MKKYRKRIFDAILARKLQTSGAILVEGIKWCGKTTSCEQAAKSVIYFDEPQKREQNILLAKIDPDEILKGDYPRLIDEWQLAPIIWDAIRYKVDHADSNGIFLLTGSAVPAKEDEMFHSGTGRFSWIKMRPMSLWESGESSGKVSLKELFAGKDPTGARSSVSELPDIAFLLCRGGFPNSLDLPRDLALDPAFDYLEAVVKKDRSRCDGVNRDEERARRLLRSLARLQGTQSSASVISADLEANEASSFDTDTVYSYINALKKIFTIEDMPSWCPNLRSKTPIRTADTRYFADPSIATASLRIGPGGLMNDLKLFGILFETMAVRDLRVYAEASLGEVRHYHDASGLECDAVVYLRDGSYGLVEIKIGGQALIDKGAETLKKLADKIDDTKMQKPSFMMILTAVGDLAYRRPEDGVFVCPIGCLKD